MTEAEGLAINGSNSSLYRCRQSAQDCLATSGRGLLYIGSRKGQRGASFTEALEGQEQTPVVRRQVLQGAYVQAKALAES